MQFTIISSKLPSQTDATFKHEFRVVHAEATRLMASSTGIISRYVQGLRLSSDEHDDHPSPPSTFLPAHENPPQALSQLSWPSPAVLGGSLHTAEYKESAGKHVFAVPGQLFMTERLESDEVVGLLEDIKANIPEDEDKDKDKELTGGNPDGPVVVVTVLQPLSESDEEFRKKWDKHAELVREKLSAYSQAETNSQSPAKHNNYQRNLSINLPIDQANAMLGDTPFLPELYEPRGGYEEIAFRSWKEAQGFLERYGGELGESYRGFCGERSYCAAFDLVVQFHEGQRGVKEQVMGVVVSNVLRAKWALGV